MRRCRHRAPVCHRLRGILDVDPDSESGFPFNSFLGIADTRGATGRHGWSTIFVDGRHRIGVRDATDMASLGALTGIFSQQIHLMT